MNAENSSIENLAYKFFREFARYEYCLKAVGLRKKSSSAQANWSVYAAEVTHVFDNPQNQYLIEAIDYLMKYPPKKQIVENNELRWDNKLPDHTSKAELTLLLICRIRNNLFHGGKFNGQWFEPERSEYLMQHGLVVLKACAENHQKVREAYSGSAFQ
jgi:hypothetical protein